MRASEARTWVFLSLVISANAACTLTDTDVTTLNYALTLEHLEAEFYRQGLVAFSSSDFVNSGFSAGQYAYLQVIAAHEVAHVTALNATLSSKGCVAYPPCTYKFAQVGAFGSVQSFLATASALEAVGTSAYDGAINSISDAGLREVAATIATVEARHAATLRDMLATLPFPLAFDVPVGPNATLAAAATFITSCPFTLPLPQPLICHFGNSVVNETGPTNYSSCMLFPGDAVALNYALGLEHLEAAFYARFLATFTSVDFVTAGYNRSVYDYLLLVGGHESAHVTALTNILQGAGCSAVPACQYNWSTAFSSVHGFLETSAALERTGVSAYDGSINTIRDSDLRTAAASIATVEARHSAYLNRLLGLSPFPDDFDVAVRPATIQTIVATYTLSCPYTLQLPTVQSVECSPSAFVQPSGCTLAGGDVAALNYALTLEHLEATYYTQGLAAIAQGSFLTAGYSASQYAYLTTVSAHEQAHVEYLQTVLNSSGCRPVPVCSYNFSGYFDNVANFLTGALALETTGVHAYDGAINTIRDPVFRQAAATIASIEARHTAVLSRMLGVSPFPMSFDNATDPLGTLAIASGFITSCPYPFVLPSPVRCKFGNFVTSINGTGAVVNSTCQLFDSDLRALNYALNLEQLEAAFYNNAPFTQVDYTAANLSSAYSYVQLVRSHENAHVTALRSAITGAGCDPVAPCVYNAAGANGYANLSTFLTVSRALENTGVSAYAGAIDTIRDDMLREIAATIHTVEARHAAFIGEISGGAPWGPTAFDQARTPSEIFAIAAQFQTCPAQPLPSSVALDCQRSAPTCNLTAGDVSALNYALTLEHLESAFYSAVLAKFGLSDFTQAGFASSVYDYVVVVAAHEAAHVTVLTNILTDAGCLAVPPCMYNWGGALNSVGQALAVASSLEGTGVSAYDGAINTIKSAALREAAATIASVEARHAATLRDIQNENPFPDAFDAAVGPAGTYAVAGAFISSCPYSLYMPEPVSCTLGDIVSGPVANRSNPNCMLFESDTITLNYALALEHLEAAFYTQGLAVFNQSSFMLAGYNNSVRMNLQIAGAHETAHVAGITQILSSHTCSAVPACTYNFASALSSVSAFISAAATLEALGVSAYAGALNKIRDTGLRQTAATIETVEARHSAYLNRLAALSPSPTPFDRARNTSEVLAAASAFIVSCPTAPSGPINAVMLDCMSNASMTTGASITASTGSVATTMMMSTGSAPTSNGTSVGSTSTSTTAVGAGSAVRAGSTLQLLGLALLVVLSAFWIAE